MKLHKNKYFFTLIFYSIIGMILGYLILHPISMLIMRSDANIKFIFLDIFLLSFSSSHYTMALYFIILGAIVGIIQGYLVTKLLERRNRIQTLEGLLPICASCKRIRINETSEPDTEKWIPVELYFSKQSKVAFSHGICPDCRVKLYPEYSTKKKTPLNPDDIV